MLENIIEPFLPQTATVISFLILFISGYKVINTAGGIPTTSNGIVSKFKSLIIILLGGIFTLFILEPLIENFILYLLYQIVPFVFPALLILVGLAILKFDENMRWDYSRYGYGCIIIGTIMILYDLRVFRIE